MKQSISKPTSEA